MLELETQIANHEGKIEQIEGVFGENTVNWGIVEKYVGSEMGMQTKFYGCNVLYPGKIDNKMIDASATFKSIIITSVRFILKNKLFFALCFPFLIVFQNKLLKDLIYMLAEIYEKDLKQKTLTNLKQFSPPIRELIRAGFKCAERIPTTRDISFKYAGIWHEGEPNPQEYQVRVRRLIWAIATPLQADSAYYFPFVDVLSLIREKTIKEFLDIFEVVLKRDKLINDRIINIKRILKIILKIPRIKRILTDFLEELDIKQFIIPDNVRYFAYRRQCYDFEGKPWEERNEWVQNLDKRLGNVIITSA